MLETAGERDPAATTLRRMSGAENYRNWILERSEPYLGRRVLDAGAGVGTFTELAADRVDRVVAVEPDDASLPLLRERLRDRANVEVLPLGIERVDGAGSFDSIMCFNVLEHIPDDRATVRRFHSLLAPGGHLLLLVPAHPLLFGATDRAVGHCRRYRRESLRQLLDDAGFETKVLRHVNPVGAAGWLLSSRILGREAVPSAPLKIFDRAVPVVRKLDRLELPIGLSLWAVAQRREGASVAAQAPA